MKRVFAIPVLVFAAFAVFLYITLPQIEANGRAKSKFLQAEQNVRNRQDYFIGLQNTLTEMSGYQDILSNIGSSISGELSLVDLIGFFSKKASDSGLTLKSVAPIQGNLPDDVTKKTNKAMSQSFVISLSGSLGSLESFLGDLEKSARLVEVSDVALQKEDESGVLEIKTQVNVYY